MAPLSLSCPLSSVDRATVIRTVTPRFESGRGLLTEGTPGVVHRAEVFTSWKRRHASIGSIPRPSAHNVSVCFDGQLRTLLQEALPAPSEFQSVEVPEEQFSAL
jgi:hypothetical protein